MQSNVVICGVGGQGVLTAGKLLSTAALSEGIQVVMSEIHGLAQRGGAVSVDVRIGSVLGPIVPDGKGDLIIAMEPLEALRVLHRSSRESVFVVNTQKIPPVSLGIAHREYPSIESLVSDLKRRRTVFTVNALELARKTGELRTASTIMVSMASALYDTGITDESFLNAIKRLFPPRYQKANIEAFDLGRKEAAAVVK